MAELRHSSSLGTRSTSSPRKRGEDTVPLVPEDRSDHDNNDDDDRHFSRDRDRTTWHHYIYSLFPFFGEEVRASPQHSRISLAFLGLVFLVGLVSVPSIWIRLNGPYLCKKDGIVLHCPRVKEPPSLWENPFSATTSWKPCAERRDGQFSGFVLVFPKASFCFYLEERAGIH